MNIETIPFKKALIIERKVNMFGLRKTFKDAYEELYKFLKSNSLEDNNHAFGRYKNVDWDLLNNASFFKMFMLAFTYKYDLEIGVSLKEKPSIDFKNLIYKEYGDKKFVTIMHYGPYCKIGSTYKTLYKQIKENNLKVAKDAFEIYLNDPNKVAKKDLQTKIYVEVI